MPEEFNEEQAAFFRDYPQDYRRMILKVFREFTNEKGNEMGKPISIVNQFTDYMGENINNIYDDYYEYIRNMKKNTNSVLKDKEKFLLLERFVWDHCKDRIETVRTSSAVQELYLSLKLFFRPNNIFNNKDYMTTVRDPSYTRKHTPYIEGMFDKDVSLEIKKFGKLYKLHVNKAPKLEEMLEKKYGYKRHNTYIYIKQNKSSKYLYSVWFNNETAENIYYGIFDEKKHLFMMKNLYDNSSAFAFLNSRLSDENKIRVIPNKIGFKQRHLLESDSFYTSEQTTIKELKSRDIDYNKCIRKINKIVSDLGIDTDAKLC